jgi:hypothetical protein
MIGPNTHLYSIKKHNVHAKIFRKYHIFRNKKLLTLNLNFIFIFIFVLSRRKTPCQKLMPLFSVYRSASRRLKRIRPWTHHCWTKGWKCARRTSAMRTGHIRQGARGFFLKFFLFLPLFFPKILRTLVRRPKIHLALVSRTPWTGT